MEPTLRDLYSAINADSGLTALERSRLLSQIKGSVGFSTSDNTLLSKLTYKGLGGVIGAVIGRYFGLSLKGQALSALGGFGLGTAIYNKTNTKPQRYKGYSFIDI